MKKLDTTARTAVGGHAEFIELLTSHKHQIFNYSSGPPFTGPYGNGQFWQTQLAEQTAISYVNIFARTDDHTQNGSVRISIVGADATTIVASADVDLSVQDFNLSRYDFTQVFAGKPVGSYVRVESLDTNRVLTLAEVEVFGPAPAGIAGDYNGNGNVDAAYYVLWRKNNGLISGATVSKGDAKSTPPTTTIGKPTSETSRAAAHR